MRPLDQKSIAALRKVLESSTQPCPPYVLDFGDEVAVTNQSILLSWPADGVDKGCSQYHKLIENTKHKLAMPEKWEGAWCRHLFSGGKFVKVEEVDPTGDTEEGSFVYQYRKNLIEYDWTNFELVELFLDHPLYLLYIQPKASKFDARLHMMGVFDQELNSPNPIGVFSNNLPRKK